MYFRNNKKFMKNVMELLIKSFKNWITKWRTEQLR